MGRKSSTVSDRKKSEDALIGMRLRTLRKIRGLSLQTLSEKTALSIGLVSQVERGLSSATVKNLAAFSRALGVTISWFFEDGAPGNEDSEYVVRRDARRRLSMDSGSVRKELLTAEGGKAQHRVFVLTVEPGGNSGKGAYSHDGDVCGLLISGDLYLSIEKKKMKLKPGDSFSIPRDMMRRFVNPSKREPAVLFWSIAYFAQAASGQRGFILNESERK